MSATFRVVANMTLWQREVEFAFSTMSDGGYMGNITFPEKVSVGDIMRGLWAEVAPGSDFPLGEIRLELEQVMAVMKDSKDGKSSIVMFEILIEGVKLGVYFIKDNIKQTESTLFLINPKNTIRVDNIPGVDVQLPEPISADLSLSLCTGEAHFTLGNQEHHYHKGFGFDCYIKIPDVLEHRFNYNHAKPKAEEVNGVKVVKPVIADNNSEPVKRQRPAVERQKTEQAEKEKPKSKLKWKKLNKKLGAVATIHQIGIGYFDPKKAAIKTETRPASSQENGQSKEVKKVILQFDLTVHISKLHIGLIGLRLMIDPQKLIFSKGNAGATEVEVIKAADKNKGVSQGKSKGVTNKAAKTAAPTGQKANIAVEAYNRLKAAVSFELDGLAIGLVTKTLSLAGLLAKQKITIKAKEYEQYVGGLVVKIKSFNITGIGAYGKIDGYTSFFFYAIADIPNVGPPAFTIQKIALGLGYNRQVKIPKIDGVGNFPLVKLAMADDDPDTDIVATITKIAPIITEVFPPKRDHFFFAVGLKFNSFKLLDGFLLLIISFGEKLRIDLLGLFIMSQPKQKPFVVLKIAIKATIIPEDGIIQIDGLIVDGSYIFSKKARLKGGFAFYTWTKDVAREGISAGDFVLTVGGYHPRYQKPKHYPDVHRFGLDWRLTDNFTIKAEAYFALTPSAFMAGGLLSAVYKSEKLDVWFEIYANFLIQWKPFAYDIEMGMSIGLEYRTWCKTYRFSLSANIHIWGPEFAGQAILHIGIISKTVEFGKSDKPSKQRIEWGQFQKELLPPRKEVLSLRVVNGVRDENRQNQEVEVNPLEFELEAASVIPISSINAPTFTKQSSEAFGIYPVKDTRSASAEFKVQIIYKNEAGKVNDECDFFEIETIQKNLPAALWSTEETLDLNAPKPIIPAVVGIKLKPRSPEKVKAHAKPLALFKAPEFSEFMRNNAWDWNQANCFQPASPKGYELKNAYGIFQESFEETRTDFSEFALKAAPAKVDL